MAEVFKAKSFGVEGFEKVLVIKCILPKLAESPAFVDMFVHEAKLAVRLSHANIVQVFDLGRVDHPTGEPTSYYIAMEYVPGLDLASVLLRCRRGKIPIPLGMAAYVAAEVAKALDHAHRRRDEQSRPLGIVHRDISPQNVLLSWEGEVKVTDFGIAKAKTGLDDEAEAKAGRVRGKLAYMSPEQSRGEVLDGRSDLFSLGVVLYEMIAGSNPFAAPTSFETLRRVGSCEYPPLEILRSDAPRELAAIVGTLLTKRPDDRIADAGRLHEELLGWAYSSRERFGANDLADFLAPFRDKHQTGELEAGIVFADEPTGANERTPVEVPQSMAASRPGTPARSPITGERPDTGQIARAADMGERREVTALVVSFAKARSGAGGIADEETGDRLVARACDVLGRYGAVVLEREPHQITALFGLGDADGRDTEAAVRAGLVILRAPGASTVSAGVAVARILVGAHGAPVRDERLASLVASAQSLARATEGRVAVSPLAGRIVRATFATEELSASAVPEGGRLIASARPPAAVYGRFVGRTEELRFLGDVLAKATRRKPQLALITGDKGIGKTRLLAEMERRLSKGNYNVGFYVASCPVNGADVPWSGMTAMLQILCGVHEGDDEERVLAVVPRLRALGLHDDELSAVLGQLGATQRRDAGSPALNTSAALRAAFGHMVQSLCDDRLQVLAWDDAQSMDAATIDAVLATATRTGGALRAVFLLSAREAPVALKSPELHQVSLGELSGDDSARLLATRIGARILPPELIGFCRERAGGHPLFLEELVKELTDSGAISVMGGAVRAKLDGTTAIPRTLRTLIAARVSRLEASDRAVLQAAAILGEPIFTEILAAMLQQNLAQIDRAVAGLAARDLLRVTGPAQVGFASPMHGEIVLDAIVPEARRELHAAAAAAYLATWGEATEHAERVAQHLYQAGDRDRAATFFAHAASGRIRVGQLEPAIVDLCRGLDLADVERRSAEELSGWLGDLAAAVSRVRSAPDLPTVTARALRRIDAVGSLDRKVLARVDLARALGSVNLFDQAYAHLDEAFTLAGETGTLRSAALVAEVEMGVRSGDFARAARAADGLEALGTTVPSRTLLSVAQARAARGDAAGAFRVIDRCEEQADPTDLVAASERAKQRVLVHIYTRDFKGGVAASSHAVEVARSAGLRFEVAAALHNLGDAARRMGDLPRAYASFKESMETAEAAGHERLVSLNRVHLAYLDGLRGDEAAFELLEQLIRYAEGRGYWTDVLEARLLRGLLLEQRGQTSEAKRELEDVARMAASYGNNLVGEDAREALARLEAPAPR